MIVEIGKGVHQCLLLPLHPLRLVSRRFLVCASGIESGGNGASGRNADPLSIKPGALPERIPSASSSSRRRCSAPSGRWLRISLPHYRSGCGWLSGDGGPRNAATPRRPSHRLRPPSNRQGRLRPWSPGLRPAQGTAASRALRRRSALYALWSHERTAACTRRHR
jgi:hypothetical protein